MSLSTNVTDLATRVASEAKSLRTLINGNAADLSGLTTVAKSNLVAAINEIAAAVGGAGAQINDGAPSTLSVWSSSKTSIEIDASVAALVDSSPETLDTLKELAAALGDDPNFAATIASQIATKEPVIASGTTTQFWRGDKTWQPLPAAPVTSVAGRTGSVVLAKADVGLGSVDNTSDAAKPVSTAQATALSGKASTLHNHTVSQISDASVVGQSLMKASDGAAARALIGAGTGSSNLTLGTTAGTAADAAAVGDTSADFVTTFNEGLA